MKLPSQSQVAVDQSTLTKASTAGFTVKFINQDADVFIGYSTTDGEVSMISKQDGTTPFFSALTQCLLESYEALWPKHLDDIFTQMTRVVKDSPWEYNKCTFQQVAEKQSTLTKSLYFPKKHGLEVSTKC